MQRRDYIERLIEELAATIARAIALVAEKKPEQAEELLDGAWTASLGMRRADAMRFDDATLRMMLGAKAPLAARLIIAQADVLEARGRSAEAAALRSRAERLAAG